MSAKNVKKNLGGVIWSNAFKISIVRNPYDMAVSMFFFENKHIDNWTSETFNQWCIKNSALFSLNRKQYLIDGQEVINFYIKFENFQEDILKLEARFSELTGLYHLFQKIKAKAFSGGKTTNPNDIVSLQGAAAHRAGFGIGEGLDYEVIE
jgi:hypothetical protein